jgi:hypothetical protein
MITYSKQENQGDCLETITVAGIRFIERYRHRDGLVQYMHEGNFYMFKKIALGVFLKRNEILQNLNRTRSGLDHFHA